MGFNVAVTLIGFLGGWVLKSLTDRMAELQTAEHGLRNKLQAMEILVAGQYVKRADLDKMGEAIFKKLDRIEERMFSSPSHN